MNTGIDYKLFYDVLLNLRELFHSYGRIDDSNSKLDEIVKLILLSYYEATKGKKFNLELVKSKTIDNNNDVSSVAITLRALFEDMAKDKMFLNVDGTSIFGANPCLNLQPTENDFAENLIAEIEKIDFKNLLVAKQYTTFDIINECFGHFVRENFRNNKEDAQYMTPAEITDAVLDCVFSDFCSENYFATAKDKFIVMDPTCGVGTLLIASAKKYVNILKQNKNNPSKSINEFLNTGIIGQDKVDRMVRLSKLNSLLLGAGFNQISSGNSISEVSPIDKYYKKVDFIFTNPPFGAEYSCSKLKCSNFPLLDNFTLTSDFISSEILMLLKCLSFLKEGGKLAIVLPDSIFSAKSINSEIRHFLLTNYTINAIIELPIVTFAQAGTRTKTSVLYLTNKKPTENHKIIMASCKNIGFNVKERLGVPIKFQDGINDMPQIANAYLNKSLIQSNIINSNPSVTAISSDNLIDEILNPSFYSAERYSAENLLNNNCSSDFILKPLSTIANFNSLGRKSYDVSENIKHISVLHINPDCTIDFQQVFSYKPICKGRECLEGDLLFSKINPRIPRMAVVPKCSKKLVCSNEFEILRSSCIGKYTLCLLLKTSYVSKQIESLTSGTSSSHCRIKREQLMSILIPCPNTKEKIAEFEEIETYLSDAFETKYSEDIILRQVQEKLESIVIKK